MEEVDIEAVTVSALTVSGPAVAASPAAAGDGPRQAPHCDSCSGFFVGFQVGRSQSGRTCRLCPARLEYRRFAYKCQCIASVCKECVSNMRMGESAPVVQHDEGDAEHPPDAHSPDDLLAALRQLPEAFPSPPILWVPRRCKAAAAEMLRQLLANAAMHAKASPGNVEAEVAHRLLRAAPQILFRLAPEDDTRATGEDEHHYKHTLGAVRDRLRRAARGLWAEMLLELLAEVNTQVATRRSQPPPRCPALQPEQISDATLQAAALKSRHGSDKGACQLLVGGPAVPPGAETDEKVSNLVFGDIRILQGLKSV